MVKSLYNKDLQPIYKITRMSHILCGIFFMPKNKDLHQFFYCFSRIHSFLKDFDFYCRILFESESDFVIRSYYATVR